MAQRQRQQNSTSHPIALRMVLSSDHVSPGTGLTVSVQLSKDGGLTWGAASGAVTEITSSDGIYWFAGNAGDRNTLGTCVIKATATGADDFLTDIEIVPWDPFAILSALPDVAAGSNGGLPLQGGAVPNANAGAYNGIPTVQANAAEIEGTAGKVWYVSKGGNDSNDGQSWATAFLTVNHAIGGASSGDVVRIGLGTFDESTNSMAVTGLTLIGLGWGTIIQGSNIAGTGAIFDVRGTCRFKNLKIQSGSGAFTGSNFNYPIYFATDGAVVICENVWVAGITDCLYKPSSAANVSAFCKDSYFTSAWDCLATRGGTQVWQFDDCTFVSTGPTGATGVQASTGIILRGTACNARFNRCYIEAGGDTYGNTVLVANVGTCQLIDSHVRVYGSGALVNLIASAASIIVTGDSTYDPALATTSSGGTITRVGPLFTTAGTTQLYAGLDLTNVRQATAPTTLANITVPTVTTLTNLPTIPANWITAAGINAGALNGKGDWLLSSSYTAPDNTDIASIVAVTNKVNTMLATSGGNWTYTVDAVKNAPGGGSGGVQRNVTIELKNVTVTD